MECRRNSCPWCRRKNVQETAAKLGINETLTEKPVRYAVLSTTRTWVDDATLREGWAQFARRVRKEVCPESGFFWVRERTTGRRDGIRRTHYHSGWNTLEGDDQAAAVAAISNQVWGRIAGAYSERAHGWQRVWDAGGLARYMAGLVGHHLKESQALGPEFKGRRFAVSRGFYAIESSELNKRARAAVRDQRLVYRLEKAMASDESVPDALPEEIWDEMLTKRLEAARALPKARIVPVPRGYWG